MLAGDIATNLSNAILQLQDRAASLESADVGIKDRITALEDYIKDNLTFSVKAWLSNSYLGSAYLSNIIE